MAESNPNVDNNEDGRESTDDPLANYPHSRVFAALFNRRSNSIIVDRYLEEDESEESKWQRLSFPPRKCVSDASTSTSDPNGSIENPQYADELEMVVAKHDLNGVNKYLDDGGNINVIFENGKSPLIEAVCKGSVLYLAAINDREEYIEKVFMTKPGIFIDHLICKGADVNQKDFEGKTALFYAINHVLKNEIVEILLNGGADVNARDAYSNTVLTINFKCFGRVCDHKQVIDSILNKGFDLKLRYNDDKTIIHRTNCNYLICLSVKNGVPIDSKDSYGVTPLMEAVKYYEEKKVKSLLDLFFANPNEVDLSLNNSAHYVSMIRSSNEMIPEKILNILFYYGVDLRAKNARNETPLDKLICDYFTINQCESLASGGAVKHMMLFYNENERTHFLDPTKCLKGFMKRMYRYWYLIFNMELQEMRKRYLKENLTFYDFCNLQKVNRSKIVNISIHENNCNFTEIKKWFPIYYDIIVLRIEYNEKQKNRKNFIVNLENIIIKPSSVQDNETESEIQLIYDCKYYLARYLSCNEFRNLLFASLEDNYN